MVDKTLEEESMASGKSTGFHYYLPVPSIIPSFAICALCLLTVPLSQ
jgi:hypothetical protein